jgi:fructose-1,6-bisphosphatase-3
VHNGNLLFHGCVPMTADGTFMEFTIGEKARSGREFMDYADRTARKAYHNKRGTPERSWGMDFLWWLWCGRNSPIFGRDRMTTFERCFIKDESTWAEPKNAYYAHYNNPDICQMLLKEFGLQKKYSRIINGHVPVKARKGESPIKGGGKLLVIDGGFSRAYQKTSGIAGYTLIFSSRYFRIVSHQPFAGIAAAVNRNEDIDNDLMIIEKFDKRMKVAETDEGVEMQAQVDDLVKLIEAYRNGAVAENHQA